MKVMADYRRELSSEWSIELESLKLSRLALKTVLVKSLPAIQASARLDNLYLKWRKSYLKKTFMSCNPFERGTCTSCIQEVYYCASST